MVDLGESFYDESARFYPVKKNKEGVEEKILGNDGQPIWFEAHGISSKRYAEFDRKRRARVLARMRKGKREEVSVEQVEEETNNELAYLITGWSNNFDFEGTSPYPYTEENAKKLMAAHSVAPIRDQLSVWLGELANFSKS